MYIIQYIIVNYMIGAKTKLFVFVLDCALTKGGEEELSISCRVGASKSRTSAKAAKKQGAKRPAN